MGYTNTVQYHSIKKKKNPTSIINKLTKLNKNKHIDTENRAVVIKGEGVGEGLGWKG